MSYYRLYSYILIYVYIYNVFININCIINILFDSDTTLTKLPETKKVLLFGFNIPVKGTPINEAMEQMIPLMMLVIYCMEKVKRFHLSREVSFKTLQNIMIEVICLKH